MPYVNLPASICRTLLPNWSGGGASEVELGMLRAGCRDLLQHLLLDNTGASVGTVGDLPDHKDPGARFNLSLRAAEDKAVRRLARERQWADGDAVVALVQAALSAGLRPTAATEGQDPLVCYRRPLGLGRRAEQSALAQYLLLSLTGRAIGMVEGATGLGKTLALLAVASEHLGPRGAGRVLIAVPTLQILRDYMALYQQMLTKGSPVPAARAIVGRQEFVCASALASLLEEEDIGRQDGGRAEAPAPLAGWVAAGGDLDMVRRWLATGGAPPADAPLRSPWLSESLLAIAPDFPVDLVRLHPGVDAQDRGAVAYTAQFSRDDGEREVKEIVLCTHAMVAVDIRRRWLGASATEEGKAASSARQQAMQEAQRDRLRTTNPAAPPASEDSTARHLAAGLLMRDAFVAELDALARIARSADIGMLPPFQSALIDEAHLFESNVANALAHTVSLYSYRRHLTHLARAKLLPASAIRGPLRAFEVLRKHVETLDTADGGDIDLLDTGPSSDTVRALLAEISAPVIDRRARLAKAANQDRNPASAAAIRDTLQQADAITLALRARTNTQMRARLQFSPVLGYPQLAVGRASVRADLELFWGTLDAAACVSATLYLTRGDNTESAGYMQGILSIPPSRMREFPTVTPGWVRAPVTALWIPESVKGTSATSSDRLWLRPPSRRDKLEPADRARWEDEWLDEVAEVIGSIYAGNAGGVAPAAGGTLVLCTSYVTVEGLARRLVERGSAVLSAQRQRSLSHQRAEFFARRAERPIWLAVGGAWTGLDVNGDAIGLKAEEDNLITELVIPRLPFGTNRSLTHQTRMERTPGMPWDLLDAAMRTKQGLGRPIRREGLPHNRRFWILDGRLNDDDFAEYLAPIRRLLVRYPIRVLARSALQNTVSANTVPTP